MKRFVFIFFVLVILGCGHSINVHRTGTSRDSDERKIYDLKNDLEQNPLSEKTTFSLAMAFININELDSALAYLDSTLTINPTHANAKTYKGKIYFIRKEIDIAFPLFLDVLKSTDNPDAVDQIAQILGQPFHIYQLTHGDYNNAFGNFFANGEKIVYQSNRSGNWDIYTMTDKGKNDAQVTAARADEELPAVSHDGNLIAYVSNFGDTLTPDKMDQQRDIFMIDMKTGANNLVSASKYDDWFPSFTHRDNEIVFTSERDDPRDVSFDMKLSEIYITDTDNGDVIRLTHNDYDDGSPCVTRDGKHIIYASNPDNYFQIFRMRTDGTDIKQLVQIEGDCGAPNLSFDGRRLTFFAKVNDNFDIYEKNMITGKLTRLTNHPGVDSYPRYSPDRRRILFQSNRAGKFQIYYIDLTDPIQRHELIAKIEEILQ